MIPLQSAVIRLAHDFSPALVRDGMKDLAAATSRNGGRSRGPASNARVL
jgi:hypothetical protein